MTKRTATTLIIVMGCVGYGLIAILTFWGLLEISGVIQPGDWWYR